MIRVYFGQLFLKTNAGGARHKLNVNKFYRLWGVQKRKAKNEMSSKEGEFWKFWKYATKRAINNVLCTEHVQGFHP